MAARAMAFMGLVRCGPGARSGAGMATPLVFLFLQAFKGSRGGHEGHAVETWVMSRYATARLFVGWVLTLDEAGYG